MKLRILLAGIAAIAAGIAWRVAIVGDHSRPQTTPIAIASPNGEHVTDVAEMPDTAGDTGVAGDDDEANAVNLPPELEVETTIPVGESQLAVVLTAPALNDVAKSQAVFALLATLPEEALAEASERAAELLPDADYASVAAPVITNAETHGRVISVLFADLMERPDAITLPILLLIAQTPEHPFTPSAIDNLRLLLNADFGTDWTRWASEIHRALAPAQR